MDYNHLNVALLTNFQEFNPGYSLTGIVLDQASMLLRHGHTVHILVSTHFNDKYNDYLMKRIPLEQRDRLHVDKIVTFGHLIDYDTSIKWTLEHKVLSCDLADVLVQYFRDHNIQIAFTHDWIFTGWNLPYAGAVRFASHLMPNVAWLHWVHSVPSVARDWWKMSFYGPQHKIVFPNITDSRRVAEQFQTSTANVFVIPHIKDPRHWFDFSHETNAIIDKYPKLMSAEIVQVYPASTDRLEAKGLDKLITIFSILKRRGVSVCLLIANQWATGKGRPETLEKYHKLAITSGLQEDEFGFTSEIKPEYVTGISSQVLRNLMLLGTLFIFPTSEESFGLVGPEAALCGNMIVTNESLDMMREVFDNRGYPFPFGSFHNQFEPHQGWDKYLENVSFVIMSKYINDASLRARVLCRQRYNMDALYNNRYAPSMMNILATAESCQQLIPEIENKLRSEMQSFRDQYNQNKKKAVQSSSGKILNLKNMDKKEIKK